MATTFTGQDPRIFNSSSEVMGIKIKITETKQRIIILFFFSLEEVTVYLTVETIIVIPKL